VQEPTARVEAPALREVPPANAEGRVFRRFLAQDLRPNATLRIDVPRMSVSERETIYRVVLYVLVAAMAVALALAARRGRGATRSAVAPPPAPTPEPRSRALVRAIATLDDDYDRAGGADDSARSEYESTRASLKRELADVLAAERKPS
jgi:hypothetical protein